MSVMALAPLLQMLAAESGGDETAALAKVVEAGVNAIHRERTLTRFVRGEISREAAIDAVGLDWVLLTEQQAKAVEEDIAWASGK